MSIEDTPTAELVYWLYSYGHTDRMMPVVARRLEALEANNVGWQGLAADLEHLENERDKYREHSMLLNRVAWKIATALNLVAGEDEIRELDSPEQVLQELDLLIASRDSTLALLSEAVYEWNASASRAIVAEYVTEEAQAQAFDQLEAEIAKYETGGFIGTGEVSLVGDPVHPDHFEPFDEYGVDPRSADLP